MAKIYNRLASLSRLGPLTLVLDDADSFGGGGGCTGEGTVVNKEQKQSQLSHFQEKKKAGN